MVSRYIQHKASKSIHVERGGPHCELRVMLISRAKTSLSGGPFNAYDIYTYIHTYIHAYIHTYIHTYLHTNKYIYIYINILCVCIPRSWHKREQVFRIDLLFWPWRSGFAFLLRIACSTEVAHGYATLAAPCHMMAGDDISMDDAFLCRPFLSLHGPSNSQ